jgi:protein O-GlcNAc transferase
VNDHHHNNCTCRFSHWGRDECASEDCVEAHTNVDVTVDLAALKLLLDSRLPLVFNSTPVAQAALPWPQAL